MSRLPRFGPASVLLFLVTAMVHQVTVLSWVYLASPGRNDVDLVTPWVAGGPSLVWGCVGGWLATRVPRDKRRALMTWSLLYFVLIASVLPMVRWGFQDMSLLHALEQLRVILILSIVGLPMGVASLLMLANPTQLLGVVGRGSVGIGPLLFLVWKMGRG